MTRHQISVEAMEGMIKDEGLELRQGDVFIIRSGFTKWYESASQEERDLKIKASDSSKIAWTGVQGNLETVEWIWNHHFSAVAGDSISWEQWPFTPACPIHQYQLVRIRWNALLSDIPADRFCAGILGFTDWRDLGLGEAGRGL